MDDAARLRRFIFELTYETCRMLRHYLERLKHPNDGEAELELYLKKVQIFLSHSKHDFKRRADSSFNPRSAL